MAPVILPGGSELNALKVARLRWVGVLLGLGVVIAALANGSWYDGPIVYLGLKTVSAWEAFETLDVLMVGSIASGTVFLLLGARPVWFSEQEDEFDPKAMPQAWTAVGYLTAAIAAVAAIGLAYRGLISHPDLVRVWPSGEFNRVPPDALTARPPITFAVLGLSASAVLSSQLVAPGWISRLAGWLGERATADQVARSGGGAGGLLPKYKTCPDCAERVRAAARICKHCGHRFDSAPQGPDPTESPG